VGVLFALSASYFSLLAQSEDYSMIDLFRLFGDHSFLCLSIRKKAKNKTPQLPLDSCATRIVGRPSKLALTSHTERGLLRSSDSRWPRTPANPALLGAADGDPEHQLDATICDLNKRIWFLNRSDFDNVSLER